jgi:hypothetical protein
MKHISELLKANNKLQILDVSGNAVGVQGAKVFAEGIKPTGNLKALDILHKCPV